MIQKIIRKIKKLFGNEEILCDTCKYNYGNVCFRRERPNAKECPDYKSRFK